MLVLEHPFDYVPVQDNKFLSINELTFSIVQVFS